MSASPSFNPRSPSVKRIMQEMKEIEQIMQGTEEGTAQFAAEALESDIFEWQFAIRGPDGTDFEGGIYHGRILLPHDYPFKPPSFIMLTPVCSLYLASSHNIAQLLDLCTCTASPTSSALTCNRLFAACTACRAVAKSQCALHGCIGARACLCSRARTPAPGCACRLLM